MQETGFFRGWGGSWDAPYGQFFLSWYSGALIAHGERMVSTATKIFNTLHPAALHAEQPPELLAEHHQCRAPVRLPWGCTGQFQCTLSWLLLNEVIGFCKGPQSAVLSSCQRWTLRQC